MWPTTSQHHSRWDDAATPAALPNVAGSPTQSTDLKVGHTCYSVSDSTLYFCTTATFGAAVWASGGGGGGNDSFPSIQQTLFVDKTGGAYVADGTIQFPYNSIDAALTAALALTPGPTNRFGIIVMPGIYLESFRLRDYCYVIGMNKESCIAEYGSGSMILATDVTSGVWNMTMHETSTFYLAWCAGSNLEFHNCHLYGEGNSGNVVRIENSAALNESVFKAYGCKIRNPDPDLASINMYDDSIAEFYDCELWGYPYIAGATSDARFKVKDCRIVGNISSWGYHHFAAYDTEVDCSLSVVYDWPFNFRAVEASAVIKNCNTKTNGLSSIRDLWANAPMDVDCTDSRLEMGSDGSVWIGSPTNEVHVGGGIDQYTLFDEMLLANWAGRGEITVHLHNDDITTGIDVGSAHDRIIIDGHGHTLTHATPTTTIPISTVRGTGELWEFLNLILGESISAAVPGTGISTEILLRRLTLDGAIKLTVGTETGALVVETDHVKARGNTTDLNAVQFSCNPVGSQPKLLVTGDSYFQGQPGNPAIYWHTLAGFGDLRMAFSTILHGSLGANNPMGDDGTPTPPILYRATHCRFNSDPDVGNFLDSVAPGQRFNSFDPLVAF